MFRVFFQVPPEWREKQVDPADADVPDELVELMQPGDELWSFTSPSETWEQEMGTAGYIIVRDGCQDEGCVTLMN